MIGSDKFEAGNGANLGGKIVGVSVPQVYRLIFFSTSMISSVAFGGDVEIRKLLETVGARNRKSGVTGLLFFNDLRFAGVVEGTKHDIVEIFRSMQKDRRHADVVVVEEGWLSRRGFTGWGMAYVADSGLPNLISDNQKFQDILASENWSSIAVVEMLKFFLLYDPQKS